MMKVGSNAHAATLATSGPPSRGYALPQSGSKKNSSYQRGSNGLIYTKDGSSSIEEPLAISTTSAFREHKKSASGNSVFQSRQSVVTNTTGRKASVNNGNTVDGGNMVFI